MVFHKPHMTPVSPDSTVQGFGVPQTLCFVLLYDSVVEEDAEDTCLVQVEDIVCVQTFTALAFSGALLSQDGKDNLCHL